MNPSDLLPPLSLGGIDPLAALIGLAGLVVAIGSLIYARRVARAERAFEKPQLVVEILDDKEVFSPSNDMERDYFFAVPFSRAGIWACLVPMPIAIKNLGEKTADALELYVQIPPALNFPTDALKATMTFLDGSTKGMSMKTLRNGERDTTSLMGISIPSLNPGQHAVIHIPLFFTKDMASPLKTRVNATTKDKVDVSFTVAARFAHLLKLSFSARDTPMYGRTWRIEIVEAPDTNQWELFKVIDSLVQMKLDQDISGATKSNRLLKSIDSVCPWVRPLYLRNLRRRLAREQRPRMSRVITAEWDMT